MICPKCPNESHQFQALVVVLQKWLTDAQGSCVEILEPNLETRERPYDVVCATCGAPVDPFAADPGQDRQYKHIDRISPYDLRSDGQVFKDMIALGPIKHSAVVAQLPPEVARAFGASFHCFCVDEEHAINDDQGDGGVLPGWWSSLPPWPPLPDTGRPVWADPRRP